MLTLDNNTLEKANLLYKDVQNTLCLKTCKGTVMPTENPWVPLCMITFYVNCHKPVKVRFYIFSNLTRSMIRVFDNDTNTEIKRYTHSPVIEWYEINEGGYTVFCYGWTDIPKSVEWKLCLATLKENRDDVIIIRDIPINNNNLALNYRPNVFNLICKCLVTVQKTTICSFRLSTTYGPIELMLRCLDMQGNELKKIRGTSNVILPNIRLEFVPQPVLPPLENVSEAASVSTRSTTKTRSRGSSSVGVTQSVIKEKRRGSFDRKSIDKSSVKSFSRKSRTSKSSKETTSIISDGFHGTIYIVEGYVLKKSWPLTLAEWKVVDTVMERELYGKPELRASYAKSSTL